MQGIPVITLALLFIVVCHHLTNTLGWSRSNYLWQKSVRRSKYLPSNIALFDTNDKNERNGKLSFKPEDMKGMIDVGVTNENDDSEVDIDSKDRLTILMIISQIAEQFAEQKSIENLDPSILTESSHILCRGRMYEEIISNLIEKAPNPKAVTNLQKIDAFMRGFITAERKSRAKLKVNYLLAAAAAQKFESAMDALSASEEVDDDLLSFVRQSMKKKEPQKDGLESVRNSKDELEYDPQSSSAMESSSVSAYEVLRMIYKRVKAELLTRTNSNLKLLNAMIRCNPLERPTFLESQLRTVEQLDEFSEYVSNALSFVDKHDGQGAQGGEKIQLAADTIETIRDILRDIEELQNRIKKNEVIFERPHD